MRRLSILLTVGILWLGCLCCPDFAMANGHHMADHGQSVSNCNVAGSMDEKGCLAHHNNSIVSINAINNFITPSFKNCISCPNKPLLVPHVWQQIRQKFLEDKLIDGNKLTGYIVKRE